MRQYCFSVIGFVLFLLAPINCLGEQVDFSVERETAIVAAGTGNHYCIVDLGDLPINSTGEVKLTIQNPHDTTFGFGKLSAACSCIEARLEDSVIFPAKTGNLSLQLSTPKRSSTRRTSVAITLESLDKTSPDVRVILRYGLKGLLSFPEKVSSAALNEGDRILKVKIPFITTPPITHSSIQTRVSPEIHGLESQLQRTNEIQFVELKIPESEIPKFGLSARVVLSDSTRNIETDTVLLISRTMPVRVSPRTLRFRPADSEKSSGSGKLVAQCILRHTDFSNDSDSTDRGDTRTPLVTIQFGTQQIVPKLTELSPGVYRVKVEVDGSVFERDESKAKEQAKSNTKSELQWQVRAKTGAFSIETPFSINAPALIEN